MYKFMLNFINFKLLFHPKDPFINFEFVSLLKYFYCTSERVRTYIFFWQRAHIKTKTTWLHRNDVNDNFDNNIAVKDKNEQNGKKRIVLLYSKQTYTFWFACSFPNANNHCVPFLPVKININDDTSSTGGTHQIPIINLLLHNLVLSSSLQWMGGLYSVPSVLSWKLVLEIWLFAINHFIYFLFRTLFDGAHCCTALDRPGATADPTVHA